MAMKMEAVASAGMDSAECDACGHEDGRSTSACEFSCSAGSLASVQESEAPHITMSRRDLRQPVADVRLSGSGTLPLKHPPRLIL